MYFNGPITPLTHSMDKTTIIITGADSSIGFETTKELLKQGAKVILACRNESKAISLIKGIPDAKIRKNAIYINLDLTNFESISTFANTIKEKIGKIDILLNNAGTCFQKFQLIDGIERTLYTNYIGHVILTCLLLSNFKPKGRIINVSTIKYYLRATQKKFDTFIGKNNIEFKETQKRYDWMNCYVMSKLANLLHSVYLKGYIDRKGLDIKVATVHPGFVRNGFFENIHSVYWTFRQLVMIPFRFLLFKDEHMGAQTHLHACYVSYEELKNGWFYKDCCANQLRPIANIDNAKRLMDFTKELIIKNKIVDGYKENILEFFN